MGYFYFLFPFYQLGRMDEFWIVRKIMKKQLTINDEKERIERHTLRKIILSFFLSFS